MPLYILRLTIPLLGISNRLQILSSRSCVCSSILNKIKIFHKESTGNKIQYLFLVMSLNLPKMFHVFSGVSGLITQQK